MKFSREYQPSIAQYLILELVVPIPVGTAWLLQWITIARREEVFI